MIAEERKYTTLSLSANVNIPEFIDAIDSYIRWYNDECIKLTLGGKSPDE